MKRNGCLPKHSHRRVHCLTVPWGGHDLNAPAKWSQTCLKKHIFWLNCLWPLAVINQFVKESIRKLILLLNLLSPDLVGYYSETSIHRDFLLFYSVLSYLLCICPLFVLTDGLGVYFPVDMQDLVFLCSFFPVIYSLYACWFNCVIAIALSCCMSPVYFPCTVVKTTLHADWAHFFFHLRLPPVKVLEVMCVMGIGVSYTHYTQTLTPTTNSCSTSQGCKLQHRVTCILKITCLIKCSIYLSVVCLRTNCLLCPSS